MQLHLGDAYLQAQASDYQLISKACLQLSSFPMARWLMNILYNDHLDKLFSVQCKLKDSMCLESSCRTWYKLCKGVTLVTFLNLQAASDTLSTPVNLQRWQV